MKEFKFVMNEYENVCYVFVDVNMPPIDTLHLIETKGRITGNMVKQWTPQSVITKNMFGFGSNLDMIKEDYNLHYDEVLDRIDFGHLLKFPDLVGGFILDINCNKISEIGAMIHDDRFGIVKTHDQAKGMAAFCTLSQILPIYNEGWEPQHSYETMKWCIQTSDHGINIYRTYLYNALLTFKTEEKAELFLKEKIDLITDLSKAGII
jgi:hypothetical protein